MTIHVECDLGEVDVEGVVVPIIITHLYTRGGKRGGGGEREGRMRGEREGRMRGIIEGKKKKKKKKKKREERERERENKREYILV